MFDALLYCYVMMNMKYGGHGLVVADVVRALQARYRAVRATAARLWPRTAVMPRGTPAPLLCGSREAWVQSLTRLETYVASMA
jgi:hypothetical protein